MASLTPGFEYDIFISYRHNDNLEGWVTDFVQNLEKELRSTLKDSLTIYFDKNPHDGLLETHNVDKSLEGKLKCLIFIPIISQTYCDPKSFAWQHEFVAFNKLSREDQLGRDIKLGNGNVASRILPIKIHDLDADDKAIIESEIGGVLRSIEFIFKSAGVNRPLRSQEDHPQDNLNKTFYRDQVNKVANGIKEIVNAVKSPSLQATRSLPDESGTTTSKPKRNKKVVIGLLLFVIIATLGYFTFQQQSTGKELSIDKSIAVLPFADMSPLKDQEYLADGIAEDIITALSRIRELKVIGRTSSFQFKGEKVDLRDVGEKLNVSTVLEGSIMKSGSKVRITAQLINVSDGTHIWSERYDKDIDDIFAIQDQISTAISNKMKVSLLGQRQAGDGRDGRRTTSTEAYENYLRGQQVLAPNEGRAAIPFFQKAIQLDSNYADAYAGLARAYYFDWGISRAERLEHMRPLAQKVQELDPASEKSHELLYSIYQYLEWNWKLAEEEYEKYIKIRPIPFIGHALHTANVLGDIKGGIEEMKIVLDADPIDKTALNAIGWLYGTDHQFEKGKEMINKAIEIDPDAYGYSQLVYLNLQEGDFDSALQNIKRAGELDPDFKMRLATIVALIKANRVEDAQEFYRSHGAPPVGIAVNYANEAKIEFWMGHFDKGFELLELALAEKNYDVLTIRYAPSYEVVREHPRYKEFLKKIPFPPDN